MIHKQYMDFINTSPTYIFTICVMLACRGLKLSSILKQYVLLSSHTKQRKRSDRPSICNGYKQSTRMRALHFNTEIYTQAKFGNTTYARTLPDKNIQRAIFPTIPHSS